MPLTYYPLLSRVIMRSQSDVGNSMHRKASTTSCLVLCLIGCASINLVLRSAISLADGGARLPIPPNGSAPPLRRGTPKCPRGKESSLEFAHSPTFPTPPVSGGERDFRGEKFSNKTRQSAMDTDRSGPASMHRWLNTIVLFVSKGLVIMIPSGWARLVRLGARQC